MELRHLRYFVAVAEERNFTRAAQRLHIAQPPLSRQIQQLEETLGVQLFERNSRPLKLTETGKFFYSHAVQLLAQTAELESMTKRVGNIERSLSVGFVGFFTETRRHVLRAWIVPLFRRWETAGVVAFLQGAQARTGTNKAAD